MTAELGTAIVLVTFALSTGLTWKLLRLDPRWQILDHPNERSLHARPTPRSGGIAVITALVIGVAISAVLSSEPLARLVWLLAAMLLVSVTSFMDDRISLPPGVRLVAHLLAASMLVFGGFLASDAGLPGDPLQLPQGIALPVTILYVVWMLNLYNFMDGMDGFAAGMAVIGFGAFAMLGWSAGDSFFAMTSSVVAASTAGFLVSNFPPARIFMGDVGSSTLGLLVAAFSLWAAERALFPLWISLLVFSPFVVDATFTLIRRVFHGERIWEAHRTHIYQRLVRLGWGHRKTVMWEYVLMLACAVCALWAKAQPANIQWTTLGAVAITYTLLILAVGILEKRTGGQNP